MENVEIHLDFDSIAEFKIYQTRFLASSKIIGVKYLDEPAIFGDGKVHNKITLAGNADDVFLILDFIDKSIKLLEK